MAEATLKAVSNRGLGSRPARRLRKAGQLPGVIYGLGNDPVPVAVAYTELRDVLKGDHGMNTVFSLDVDGSKETVIVRNLQRDSVRRVVTHADFLRIDPNKAVKVKVPIQIVGDPSGVTSEGGMIEQQMFSLEVEALPLSVPTQLDADVSAMTLERGLSVADIVLPEGVTSAVAEEISVVAPVIPKVVAVETPVAEGEEGAEAGEGDDSADSGDSDDKAEGSEEKSE